MTYIPYLSTIVTFAFVLAVYGRYRRRGGTHLLLWTIGLFFYGLGTLSEVILSLTFSAFVLKMWYLTGAMLTAAWLGTGSVHLLVRRGSIARNLTWALGVVSALALFLLLSTPANAAVYDVTRPASEQYKDILTRNGLIIFLTVLLNIYGTLTLVGGAIYSIFIFWRQKVLAKRMYGNILIAAGALSPALGGTFLQAGLADLLYLSEFVGAVLMFFGFILATSEKSDASV